MILYIVEYSKITHVFRGKILHILRTLSHQILVEKRKVPDPLSRSQDIHSPSPPTTDHTTLPKSRLCLSQAHQAQMR